MFRRVFAILLLFFFLFSLSVSALADGAEGSVTEATVAEPDASAPTDPDQVDLSDINSTLQVIQSQLWIFLVVLLCWLVGKLFRLFF